MNMSNNTVLITGGTSGIGLALARRFMQAGNVVIICGRQQKKLDEVKKEMPHIHTKVCDTGKAADRAELAKWVLERFPQTNVLINNAGIQRKINFKHTEAWSETEDEIAINVSGPIHLSQLFIPHFLLHMNCHIMNVSSGLAFVPMSAAPVYCATKAAIHSFTQSLRFQLKGTSIKVTEIIPPAVRTNLGGAHDFGVPLDEYADSVMAGLKAGKEEVTYQFSESMSRASRPELEEAFKRLNPEA